MQHAHAIQIVENPFHLEARNHVGQGKREATVVGWVWLSWVGRFVEHGPLHRVSSDSLPQAIVTWSDALGDSTTPGWLGTSSPAVRCWDQPYDTPHESYTLTLVCMPDKRPVRTITWKHTTRYQVNGKRPCHILVPVKNHNVATSARENIRQVKRRPKGLTQ